MTNQVYYSLQPDTLLHEEYNILMQIGEGGFSITYIAECISDGNMVAIKELFNTQYMERTPENPSVQLKDSSYLPKLEQDKKSFSDEWVSMNRFAHIGGTVAPICIFEENNTAYIVMEHLGGGSLKDNVRVNSPYDPDTFIKKSGEVFHLVAEMHRMGYVHGDISPDNLVMDTGGIYKIIDFGCVRRINSSNNLEGIFRKEGYTPAEMYNKNNAADCKSDIYSLCATMYFALSGHSPIDPMERMLSDDLSPLNSFNPEIDTLIEHIVMKGLSMDPNKRWNSIEEILNEIGSFKNLEEDRAKEADERRAIVKRKSIAFFSVLCALTTLFAFVFCSTQKKFMKFLGAETQQIVLYFDDNISEEEKHTIDGQISRKMDLIAGDRNYLLSRENNNVTITMKKEILDKLNIPLFINKYFNFGRCNLAVADDGNYELAISRMDSSNIESVLEKEDGCIIVPSQSLRDAMKEFSEYNGIMFRIYSTGDGNHMWDKNNTPFEGDTYDILAEDNPDKNEIYISDEELGGEIGRKLFIDCLREEQYPIISFNYERQIIWEEKKNTAWGDQQVDINNINGESMILVYRDENQDKIQEDPILNHKITAQNEDDYDENDKNILSLKRRLDSLQTPYACGCDKNNPYEIYIAVGKDCISEVEAALLFNELTSLKDISISESIQRFGNLNIKSSSGVVFPRIDMSAPFTSDNGFLHVKINNIQKMIDTVEYLRSTGENTLQLYIGSHLVMQTQIDNISEDGWILFDKLLLDNVDVENQEKDMEALTNYINTIIQESFYTAYYSFEGVLFRHANAEYDWDKDLWSMYGCERDATRKSLSDYATSFPDECMKINSNPDNPNVVNITVEYNKVPKDKYPHPYVVAEELLGHLKWSGEITDINITFYNRDENVSTMYYMYIDKSPVTGTPQIGWSIEEINWETHRWKECFDLEDEARRLFSSSEYFSACFLQPALTYRLEKTIIDSDDITVKLHVQDTLPGQNYQFSYYVANRTSEDLTVDIEDLTINNVMTDLSGNGGYEFGPLSEGTFKGQDFSEEDLWFSPLLPLESALFHFRISYGDKEIHKQILIPEDINRQEGMSKLKIPKTAKLLDNSDEYCIYSLGSIHDDNRQNNNISRFILVNKSDEKILFNFDKLAFGAGWVDLYDPEKSEVQPYSELYFDFEWNELYAIPISDPKAMTIRIEIQKKLKDGNIDEISTKEYLIEF